MIAGARPHDLTFLPKDDVWRTSLVRCPRCGEVCPADSRWLRRCDNPQMGAGVANDLEAREQPKGRRR